MPDDGDGGHRPVPVGYLGINRRPSAREWRRALTFFAAGMVVLTAIIIFVRPKASLLSVGAAAPAITLTAAGGGQVNVTTAAAGSPYILEFFETGCSNCQQVAQQLCGQRVPVFAVDAAKDSADAVVAYRKQYAPKCSYPMLVDPSLSAASAYTVSAVPTVYVIKAGKVAYAGAGPDGVSGLDAAAQKALGG
jgi:peroxiredoxin